MAEEPKALAPPSPLARIFIVGVRGYQLFLSPFLGGRCRYDPSCSAYAIEALRLHGPWRGAWLSVRRIGRCHPWGGMGYDPVPPPASSNRKDFNETFDD